MKRMSSRTRRLVAFVLSLSMVLSGTPTPLRAEEAADESSYVLPVQPRVPDDMLEEGGYQPDMAGDAFEEGGYQPGAVDVVPVEGGGYQSDVAISPLDDAPNIGPRRELTEDELFAEGELLAMAEATTDEDAEEAVEQEEAAELGAAASEEEAAASEEEAVEVEIVTTEEEAAELEAATAEEEATEEAPSTEEVVEDEMLPAEEGPSAEEALPGEDPTTTETNAEAEDAPLFDDAENSETPAPEAPEQDGEPAEAEELPSPDEGPAEPLPADVEAAAPEDAQPLPEQEEATPDADAPAPAPDDPAATPDDPPLTPQAKSVKDYSYAVTPLLAPFNNLIYVKTDNPDPKSFRLTDKQSTYLDKGAETSFVLYDRAFCDVVYEDVATRRVRGGYIFYDYDCKSDGDALAVQALAGDGTFADVGKSVSCPTLKDRYDYLLDTYASSSMSFFEKLNAVQAGLEDISVYPRALRDASKPNTTRPYPYLATSPYRELILNDHVGETYLKNDEGLFLSALHPFVIDSLGFPGTMYNVAKRLGYTGEYKSGSNHAYVGITYGGETRYYGGAGRGDPGSLYSMHAGAPFTFDGSSSDLATHASINALTARYLDLVSKADDYTADLLDQVQGEAFDQAIGSGSWIRVVRERSQTVWYSYVADGPDGGTNAVSDAWVDGRYVNDWEEIALGEKFEDHPTASIVLHNVSYTDKSGKKRKGDVEYVYNKDKNVWWAPYYYSGAWGYVSPITLPDELILTPAEVKALVPDKNTNALPLSGLVYDGTEPPGTPFGGKAVTGVTLPKSMTVRALEHFEITAQLQPSDALHTTGQWTSSDDNMVRTFPSDRAPVYKAFAQKEGTVTLTFTSDDGGYSASCRVTALPARKSISYATINCARSAMYTGKPVTLDAEVILDDTTLAYGKDYDVTYENNTACGWARIIVVGKGDYKDSTAQYFSIYPASMKDAAVKAIADQAYTGGARKPAPVVTLNGVTLKSGTDYTVAYEDNVNVGTASVILTGKGNYSGTKTATFKIAPASIAKATVAAVPSQTYTGEAHEPAPVVTLGGVALKAGTDYTVTYKDNVNAGTATITITGKGNYTGTKTATFKIEAASLSGAKVGSIADAPYEGKPVTPKPVVTMGGKTLAEGTDYTLSYADNGGPGKGTVTVTGKGNYVGTVKASFVIDRFPDVRRGSWYYLVVNRAAELGLVNGFADGTFGPDRRVTRGQVAVMLWNMAGRPKPVGAAKSFPDVKSGAYYYNAVSWASSAGVVNGFGDGTFGPDRDVTREQLATMLASYAKRVGGLEVKGSAADFASMSDAGKVSGYARQSVGWCFRNSVISGKSGNLIDPQGTASRAETAKMVVFVHDMLQ